MIKEMIFLKNDGIKNEYEFILKLNNKRVYELNYLLQEFIRDIFPNCIRNSIVRCKKGIDYEKVDIIISIGSNSKNISIKKGHRNSVHCEKLSKFINFLNSLNIDKNIINEILKYHFADGTTDGSGIDRISSKTYQLKNYELINNINKSINTTYILNKAINRFIIQGTQKQSACVDILVYGTPDDFFYVSRTEIYDFILSKIYTKSNSIHFSCLTFQPLSRVLDYNIKREYMRSWIQIKWYNLEDNIIELMNERVKKRLNN